MKCTTTKYSCDCCEEEMKAEQFSKVRMSVNFRCIDGGCHEEVYASKDVCDKCMIDFGFDEVEVKGYRLPKQTYTLKSKFDTILKKIYGKKHEE